MTSFTLAKICISDKKTVPSKQERGSQGAGGNLPHNLEALGAPPPTLECQCRSFVFLFVFAREPGSLLKNSGSKSGEFLTLGRDYLGPRETLAPSSQLQSRFHARAASCFGDTLFMFSFS